MHIYRQHERFDDAEAAATQLFICSSDQHERALCQWSRALIQLQRGFNAVMQAQRVTCFRSARAIMWGVYRDIFSPSPVTASSRWLYDPGANANFAYYTAKAIWSSRCALGAIIPDSPHDNGQREDSQWDKRLVLTIDQAHTLFEENRNRLGNRSDPAIGAIYNACVAHMVLIRQIFSLESSNVSDDVTIRMRDPRQYFFDCLANARLMLKVEREVRNKYASDARIYTKNDARIYTETFERLATFEEFGQELELLAGWWENTYKVFDFYSENMKH